MYYFDMMTKEEKAKRTKKAISKALEVIKREGRLRKASVSREKREIEKIAENYNIKYGHIRRITGGY